MKQIKNSKIGRKDFADAPFVSVIIPTYRSNDTLHRCIAALEEQSYPTNRFEIIVVNNAPSEALPTSIDEKASTVAEAQPGSYAARNAGVTTAQGDVLAFTDADCLPEKTWLEEISRAVSEYPRSVIGGRVVVGFDQSNTSSTTAEIYDKHFGIQQEYYIQKLGFSVTANLAVRRADFDQVGTFIPELKSNGDREWCFRASQAGLHLIYAHEAIVYHPARQSTGEILRKTRRKVGGRRDTSNLNLPPTSQQGGFSKAWEKLRAIRRDHGAIMTCKVILLMTRIVAAKKHERVLLALGKPSSRV